METEVLSGRKTLLQKWEIPLEHLDFEYLKTCSNVKEIERIVRILRSGEEGCYPDLQSFAENRLSQLNPQSKVLRREQPMLLKSQVKDEYWNDIKKELQNFREEVKAAAVEPVRELRRNLPPVRALNKAMLETLETKVFSEKPKKEKIRSCEYQKWDRYDAEAEALKVDLDAERLVEEAKLQQKKGKERPVIEEIFEDDVNLMTAHEKATLAKRHKEKGNDFYRAKEYYEAIEEYTKSLNINPVAVTFNNRGMAYIKQSRFQKALEDCNSCLEMEPKNIKALLRKAQSLQGLDKRREAYEVCSEVLRVEPGNVIAEKKIKELREQLPDLPPPNSTRIKIVEQKSLPDVIPKEQQQEKAAKGGEKREKQALKVVEKIQNQHSKPEETTFKAVEKAQEGAPKLKKSLSVDQSEALVKFKEKLRDQKRTKEAYKEHFRQMMSDDVFLLPHHDTHRNEFIIEESSQ